MAKTKPIRPLVFNGPVILRADLEEGNEGDRNDVCLTIYDEDGRHDVVIDPGEVTRLRKFLERVEARGR